MENPLVSALLRRGVLSASPGVRPLLVAASMGEETMQALLQESLSLATKTEAIKPSDLNRVIVDTTPRLKLTFFTDDEIKVIDQRSQTCSSDSP